MPRLLLIALALSGCTVRAVSGDGVDPGGQQRVVQVQRIQQEAPIERAALRRGELVIAPAPTISSEEFGGQEGEPVVDPPTDTEPPSIGTPDPGVDDADSAGIDDGNTVKATGDTGDTDDTDAE